MLRTKKKKKRKKIFVYQVFPDSPSIFLHLYQKNLTQLIISSLKCFLLLTPRTHTLFGFPSTSVLLSLFCWFLLFLSAFCQPLNALSSLPRPLSYLYSWQPTLKIILTCPMALTMLCSVSSVMSNSVTPWTVSRQAPLSMGFSQQEYWNWLPCPPPRDHLHPGIEPKFPVSLHCRWILISLSHWESP